METVDIPGLTNQVLWASLALAVAFGAVAQRTRFCTMGAIADVVNMGDWERARMWALAVAVAVLGFNGMVAAGWVQASNSIYAAPRVLWLSALLGGAMFGFGMVLASGCGSKNLMRMGSGNLKALVVMLVLGLAGYATLRGITGVLRVNTVEHVHFELATGQDLPSMAAAAFGLPGPMLALALGAALALVLLVWVLSKPEGRSGEVLGGGIGVGAVIAATWWVSGSLGFVAEDPNTLEPAFLGTNSRRMESLSLVAPVAYTLDWLLFFSDTSRTLTLGILSVVGITLGAFIVSVLDRSFRWEGFGSFEDLANHLVGATLMGVGGVVAMGCTVGQGLSGVSTLSLGSFIALAGIVGGAVAALRYQVWRIERSL
ncbi:transporter [beta proteobacterium AAP121]|nr:transporter [beta proteobacterium AAP65]KPF97896.1 transporter [beta proteobacterium AAP121]